MDRNTFIVTASPVREMNFFHNEDKSQKNLTLEDKVYISTTEFHLIYRKDLNHLLLKEKPKTDFVPKHHKFKPSIKFSKHLLED